MTIFVICVGSSLLSKAMDVTTIWFLFINPVNKPTTQCTYHHIQCTLQHTATLCSLQPSIQCTSSAHITAAIASSVHILQQPLHLQCTLQPCTAMYSYLQPIFSAPCNHVQPCTAICSQSSVHTAANCSHLQPPTLQLYHSVHTAATLSDANTIQCI